MKRAQLMFIVVAILIAGCEGGRGAKQIASFPLDSLQGVLTQSGVELDKKISSDGHGSLKITSAGWTTIRLFEVELNLDDVVLIYRARLKVKDLDGYAFLEMWVNAPGRGEFFSKGLNDALTETAGWATVSTPFYLQKGDFVDRVKLNLVITGPGTVWIDDIVLTKGPLEQKRVD